MDNIEKYYLLSELTNDDIETVAVLIELVTIKPKVKILNDLQKLNLSKYGDTLEKLLDLKVSTIKDISKCLSAGARE